MLSKYGNFFLPSLTRLMASISLFIRTTWLFKFVRKLPIEPFNPSNAVKKINDLVKVTVNFVSISMNKIKNR